MFMQRKWETTEKQETQGLLPALLCFLIENNPNPRIPSILCCLAEVQKEKKTTLLYCTLQTATLTALFDGKPREKKKKPKAVKSPGFPMMSSGTAACTKASGKGEQGGFPNVLPTHVWHTRVTTHFNKSSYHSALSINSIRGVFFYFSGGKLPTFTRHANVMFDTYSFRLIKQPQR